jgi:hypothetical protein
MRSPRPDGAVVVLSMPTTLGRHTAALIDEIPGPDRLDEKAREIPKRRL